MIDVFFYTWSFGINIVAKVKKIGISNLCKKIKDKNLKEGFERHYHVWFI